MDLQTNYGFQKIWNLSINNLKDNKYNRNISYNLNTLPEFIPIEWQLILMSDGSFTQNLISLTGNIITLSIIFKSVYPILNQNKHIRESWLIDDSHRKLAFAQSLWPIYDNNVTYIAMSKNQPIGQSLVESQIDIYKDIHEIYYGYCTYLEKKFLFEGPIWGRKYTIYCHRKPLTTIQEIFSPEIINFLLPHI